MDAPDVTDSGAAPVESAAGRRKFATRGGPTDSPVATVATEIEELLDAGKPSGVAAIPPAVVESVVVDLAVELGRMKLRIREVKALRQGEIISLQRPVGDPLDITINGRVIAKGEVVATEGHRYGIRITEIVTSQAGSGDR